jgi:hypothetical protein
MIQMSHSMGDFVMTPNVIAQISAKVVITSRFLGFVDSLSSSEHQLWFPNQNVQDPVTWTLPHLIQLQHEYKELLENYNCDIQEFITVQDPPVPPSKILHPLPSPVFIRLLLAIWSYLSRENCVRLNHRLNELYLVNS